MNCWEILGIEPTNDIKAIKRAYAKQLKQINMDTEIEQFQQLKEALDLAKHFAKFITEEDESTLDGFLEEADEVNSQQPEPVQSTFDEGLKEILGDTYTSIFDETIQPTDFSEKEVEETVSVESFEEALTKFYNERRFFDDVDGWRAFLRPFMNLDIESFTQIQWTLERFLRENYYLMGNNVRNYFAELCQIDTSAPENTELFDPPALDFSFSEEIPFHQRLDYFIKRNQLYMQLLDGQSGKNLRGLLSACQQIYKEDSDLALLESFLLLLENFRLNDVNKRERLVNLQAFSTNSNQWAFLTSYIDFMSAYRKGEPDPLEPDSFYQMEQQGIPKKIYWLLAGNYAYLTKNKRQTVMFWYGLQEESPELFTKKEIQYTQRGVWSKPKKKKSSVFSWKTLVFGVIALRVLFMLINHKSTSVKPPDIAIDPYVYTYDSYSFDFSKILQSNESSEEETTSSEEETVDFEKNMTLFAVDPNDKEPVSYESYETGGFSATVPDYSHYNEQDVQKILGKPDKVVTNAEELNDLLKEKELELISEEMNSGKLTEEQARAFYAQAIDYSIVSGGDMRALLYSGEKPNVYIYNGKVGYITPKTKYVQFYGKIEE